MELYHGNPVHPQPPGPAGDPDDQTAALAAIGDGLLYDHLRGDNDAQQARGPIRGGRRKGRHRRTWRSR